jgi:hypothetical protein
VSQIFLFFLELVVVALEGKQTFLVVERKDCLDWALTYIVRSRVVWVGQGLDSAIDERFKELLLLLVSLTNDFIEQGAEVVVFDDILEGNFGATLGALVISIDTLLDALFAEGVTTLCDVRVFVSITADHALCKVPDDFVYADLERLVIRTLVLYELRRLDLLRLFLNLIEDIVQSLYHR